MTLLARAAAQLCLLLAGVHFLSSSQATCSLPEEDILRNIFIGRCNEFQLVLHPELFTEWKNCSFLWDTFRAAALGSSSCLSDPSDFDQLLHLADHTIPTNKFLFWSGVYSLIERVKDLPEYFPVDKTLMGYTMNSLEWCNRNCSSSSKDQLDPIEEPSDSEDVATQPDWTPVEILIQKQRRESCTNFTLPFWIAASKWFASKALGQASLILNASVEQPFRETSIFGQYELPLISSLRVAFVNVYLVNSLRDAETSGSCHSSSVLKLQQMLHKKDIRVQCTENPDFLVHILCSDDPEAWRCRLIGKASNKRLAPSSVMTGAAIAAATAAAATLANGGLL